VKVSDFGIAKARAASAATASEFIKGKPAYMSPEQANGQPLDGRSDLFAVGIMLWEMLVGRRLFIGEDTRATLAAVLFGQIPRPRALRGDVPKDLERVTMKLLERDLPARYATAEQAIDELLDCADAPKAGRELLTTTLAERFAAEAPVRHSQRRVRSQPAVNRSPGAPSGTMPDGAPARHATPLPLAVGAASMPSLGSVRNAPTATIDPGAAQPPVGAYPHPPAGARPGQTRKLLLAAAVLVITAFASFAIVSAVSGRDSQGRGSGGDGPGSPLASLPPPGPDAAPALPGPDAAPAPVAPIPPDAAPAPEAPDAGTPDAAKKRPVERVKMGKLSVLGGRPVVAVYWRGRKIGETPLVGYELPAGRHTIALRRQGPEVNFKDRDIPVTIQADQLTTVKQ
jgi:serine/threonine-protein kinase